MTFVMVFASLVSLSLLLPIASHWLLNSAVVGYLVDDARYQALGRSITVNCQNRSKFFVRANGELLHRAIENLVRNALRYSPVGGVVSVTLSSLGGGLCQVEIIDQGPGVSGADQEAIFTPFFRGAGQGEGYGLGLVIARGVQPRLMARFMRTMVLSASCGW